MLIPRFWFWQPKQVVSYPPKWTVEWEGKTAGERNEFRFRSLFIGFCFANWCTVWPYPSHIYIPSLRALIPMSLHLRTSFEVLFKHLCQYLLMEEDGGNSKVTFIYSDSVLVHSEPSSWPTCNPWVHKNIGAFYLVLSQHWEVAHICADTPDHPLVNCSMGEQRKVALFLVLMSSTTTVSD